MVKRFRTSSFLKTLFLVGCLIGILPLLLLGYLSYSKSASIVQEEVTTGNRVIVQQNKDKIEFFLQTVDTLTTQAINTPVTTNAASMAYALNESYRYEQMKLFQSLLYKLVQIQVFELGISDVQLISFRQDWLIEGGVLYQMHDRKDREVKDRSLHTLRRQFHDYRSEGRLSSWRLEIVGDPARSMLKLVKTVPLNSHEPSGMIAVNIPLLELSNRLAAGPQLGTMMVLDAEGTVIAHTEADKIGQRIDQTAYYQEMMAQSAEEGVFSHELDGEPIKVVFKHARYNSWTYVSLMPLEQFTEKSQSIRWYTILTILLLILLVISISIIVSYRMYSPIQKIYRLIKSDVGDKAGNELSYIGERVRQMTHDHSRMSDELGMLNRQAAYWLVIRLLQGELRSDEWEYHFEKRGFPLDWSEWCVVAIQIDSLEATRYSDKDRDLLLYAVQNMIGEIVPPAHRLPPIIQRQILLLVYGLPQHIDKPFKVAAFQMIEDVQLKIASYLGLEISFGVSRSYRSFIHAPLAYQESLDALTYRFRLDQGSVVFIDEAQSEHHGRFRYPKDLEMNLQEAIRRLDEQAATEFLQAMIVHFFTEPLNPYDYEVFLDRLFNKWSGMVQDEGASVYEVFSQEALQSKPWKEMYDPQETARWFQVHGLRPLLAWMTERQKSRNVHISAEMIRAIHEEYDQDLSIDLFAVRLNFHPNYISRVFKKETGVTFSDYLAQYRVEIAKRWLEETDMKVSDIAVKLCYSTASNFNRNFKKYLQLTPSQYREQFGKRQDVRRQEIESSNSD